MDNGKKLWVYPDLEMPPKGDFPLIGHESVIILNMNDAPANIRMTLYFDNKEPVRDIPLVVEANRVRCLRTYNPDDFGGFEIPGETQYALRIESDVPVVCQYGRLDTRQQNMAFYTVMGYSC
ncbi:MAG: sensory rhodopsin transducer [Clostridia bacterium]|nr:sensory rhodopsin transducer [Clostridia bacterium]